MSRSLWLFLSDFCFIFIESFKRMYQTPGWFQARESSSRNYRSPGESQTFQQITYVIHVVQCFITACVLCLALGGSEGEAGESCGHSSLSLWNDGWNYSYWLVSFQAIIHPDTGEKIFMPFRMSGKSIERVRNIWIILKKTYLSLYTQT